MNQESKNIIDTMMDTQKGMADKMVENTKQFAAGNPAIAETMEKGSDWYKNWLDSQKSFFESAAQKATSATDSLKENTEKAQDSYKNMMDHQAAWSRQWQDMNAKMMNSATNMGQIPQNGNPMEAMTQMWNNSLNGLNQSMGNWQRSMMNAGENPMMNMMKGFTGENPMMNMMKGFTGENPMMNMMKGFSGGSNPMTGMMNMMPNMMNMMPGMNGGSNSNNPFGSMMNQWHEMLSNATASAQRTMQSGTIQDAYRNMMNTTDGYARFAQLWSPMWKSIQDKTFNTGTFRQMMNPAQHKEMLDQYFGFMPEQMRTYIQQGSGMMQDAMKQMMEQGQNGTAQMKQMMSGMMPNTGDLFGSMLSNYNGMYSAMQNAMAPMARMSTPNQYTKSMNEWSDIANRMVQYSLKNAELQYMVYEQGSKVMEDLAQNLQTKLQNGEEVSSMMNLYQEWMNLSDKTFVKLFESEVYSQLMAEVSGMQMRLKKDMELQMEKSLVNIPVATRSELDDLYKTIYDLKKQVRQMEKMLEVGDAYAGEELSMPSAVSNPTTPTTPSMEAKDSDVSSNGSSKNNASKNNTTKK